QWDVSVSVRTRLKSDLNYPDHRNQCAQIPEPTHRQVSRPLRQQQHQGRDTAQHAQRQHHLPDRQQRPGVRIKNRQLKWPDQVTQIDNIGNQSILESRQQRESLEGTYGSSTLLRLYRNNDAAGYKQQQGSFFQ